MRTDELIERAAAALSHAEAVRDAEVRPEAVDEYWLRTTDCVLALLDALRAAELGVQGVPREGKAREEWEAELAAAIRYYSLDVRVIVSILPRGAAMKRNR